MWGYEYANLLLEVSELDWIWSIKNSTYVK